MEMVTPEGTIVTLLDRVPDKASSPSKSPSRIRGVEIDLKKGRSLGDAIISFIVTGTNPSEYLAVFLSRHGKRNFSYHQPAAHG